MHRAHQRAGDPIHLADTPRPSLDSPTLRGTRAPKTSRSCQYKSQAGLSRPDALLPDVVRRGVVRPRSLRLWISFSDLISDSLHAGRELLNDSEQECLQVLESCLSHRLAEYGRCNEPGWLSLTRFARGRVAAY